MPSEKKARIVEKVLRSNYCAAADRLLDTCTRVTEPKEISFWPIERSFPHPHSRPHPRIPRYLYLFSLF